MRWRGLFVGHRYAHTPPVAHDSRRPRRAHVIGQQQVVRVASFRTQLPPRPPVPCAGTWQSRQPRLLPRPRM